MKLSISNIGWKSTDDEAMYAILRQKGFTGLEIAPTRIFPEDPYDKAEEAAKWSEDLKERYGLTISSMQSIWYGRKEKIFGSVEERAILLEYTKKAIRFAEAVGCHNLVFGCPGNRAVPEDMPETEAHAIASEFFKELGNYASEHHTVLSMEANPPIYNTNFITSTKEAITMVREIASPGFKLNLDLGTMIQNEEPADIIKGNEDLINHVHISEPNLVPITERSIHKEVVSLLERKGYSGFYSIEVKTQDDIDTVKSMMEYVKTLTLS